MLVCEAGGLLQRGRRPGQQLGEVSGVLVGTPRRLLGDAHCTVDAISFHSPTKNRSVTGWWR
jgi:hypothetical protein